MQHERSPANDEPSFYTLHEVRCPAKREVSGVKVPCGALWDRREVPPDRSVHQVICKNCGNLILYRLKEEIVDDRAVVVILSIQRSRERAR